MKAYAEKIESLTQSPKMLIASYFANKIPLITPFVKSYLTHGRIISTVYEFIEFLPGNYYHNVGDQVSNARREGDLQQDKTILANLMKLNGNLGYGKTHNQQQKLSLCQKF